MSDISAANGILQAFSDLEGLTPEECSFVGATEGWAPEQCSALVSALGTASRGRVTAGERNQLLAAGFSENFVTLIAGPDGFEALRRRVDGLGGTAERSAEARGLRLRSLWELGEIFSLLSLDAGVTGAALAATARPHLILVATADADSDLRYEALDVIRSHPALRSLAIFRQMLSDSDEAVRALAVSSLRLFSGPSVIPDLLARARFDASPQVRERAVQTIGIIGLRTDDIVDCLQEASTDSDADVREAAARALSMIRP